MPAFRIVEALDVIEHVCLGLIQRAIHSLCAIRSVLRDERKLSSAALNVARSLIEKRPFPAELMPMWPISTRVNKPENDDPSIIEAIEVATDAA